MPNPFILTAALPGHIQGWAEGLRRAHYPPDRNQLHAHVTLFHAFAPSLRGALATFLPRITREFPAPAAEITGLMDLGAGTAIALASPQLLDVRAWIAEHFGGSLTAQDLHEPRLHITIQNKVTKREARALQAALAPTISQRRFAFPALELHLYCGGPWEKLGNYSFRGQG